MYALSLFHPYPILKILLLHTIDIAWTLVYVHATFMLRLCYVHEVVYR